MLIVIRTLLHNPEAANLLETVDYSLDEDLLLAHLSESIQFQTISHENSQGVNAVDFVNFQYWVSQTYSQLHQTLELKMFNDTMLCKWVGTDTTLKPILITGTMTWYRSFLEPNLYGSSHLFLERLMMVLFRGVARLMIKVVSLVS